MEDIAIPMLHGNMEDIAGETSTTNGNETNSDVSFSTQQQYERERRITIDYALLPENLKDIEEEDIKKTTDKLTKIINDLQNTIQRIQAPNMKVCKISYKCDINKYKKFRNKRIKKESLEFKNIKIFFVFYRQFKNYIWQKRSYKKPMKSLNNLARRQRKQRHNSKK